MRRSILIRGGRVIDPASNVDRVTDVLLKDGRIEAIDDRLSTPDDADVIDAPGMVVCPGFVDVHVHLREPGGEHKETIATGSHAAVAGGFTTVCAMPNTDPPIDDPAAVGFVRAEGLRAGRARVYPVGAISVGMAGERLTEFGEMVDAGAVGVTDDGRPVSDAGLMRLALEYARTFDIPVAAHCEVLSLSRKGSMNEGIVSTRLGLTGIPNAAEDVMIARDIILAELTGGRLHVQHVSTRGGVELIRRAKEAGLSVTAEATPHHLTLTDDAVDRYRTDAKMNPPLRTNADREAVRAGLADGTLDCIATDHAPHARDEKDVPFEQAPMGTTGLETAFAAVYTDLVLPGTLALELVVEKLTAGLGLLDLFVPTIAAGERANLVLVDLDAEWVVGESGYESRSENSCFAGRTLRGRVLLTVASGAVAYRERSTILSVPARVASSARQSLR